MSRTQIPQSTREFFGARFSDLVANWKKAAPEGDVRTNEKLAKELYTTRSTIQKWCSGESIPASGVRSIICNFFKVPENYFDLDTATPEEKYEHVSNYISEIGKSNIEFAKEIGLNISLVRALSTIVDFDDLFPIYSPIVKRSGSLPSGITYDRLPKKKTFAKNIDKDLEFLKLNRSGDNYIMHKVDLAYLKEVQDQLITFVEYLFHKRYKEMQEEVQIFNQDLIEVNVDGDPVAGSKKDYYIKQSIGNAVTFDTPADLLEALDHIKSEDPKGKNISISHRPVTWDFICEHDRFAKYTYGKEGK